MLRLIEGTTFDTRTSLNDRANQEARDELIKALDIAVDRVLGHVPLDEIRAWAQVNPIGVVGTTGVMKEAALVGYATDGWGRALDYTGNVIDNNKEGLCENRIGPCIRLAEIYSEVPTSGFLLVELDTDTDDESTLAQAVASVIYRIANSHPTPCAEPANSVSGSCWPLPCVEFAKCRSGV